MKRDVESQKRPFIVEEKPGTYAWCSCGKSWKLPYCDGKHLGTDLKPMIVKIKKAKKISWCGCGNSGNVPFCDGLHDKI